MSENRSAEIWRDVLFYDGKYRVSNLGNVAKVVGLRLIPLSPGEDRDGNPVVNLVKDGKRLRRKVSTLVAEAFVVNPLSLKEVGHTDCDKRNNRADNLFWGTHQEITSHITQHDTQARKRIEIYCVETGERFHSAKHAADAHGFNQNRMRRALNHGNAIEGLHFVRKEAPKQKKLLNKLFNIEEVS